MSRSRQRTAPIALVPTAIAAICLLAPACRREQPAASPAPSPVADGSDTATQPVDTSQGDGSTVARKIGVDDQDDANAPRALPETTAIRGWVKTQPVRVATGGGTSPLLGSNMPRAGIATYALPVVAQCRYELNDTIANVFFFQAATSDDAFGVFSILTPQPGTFNDADGSIRATEQTTDAVTMLGWQGNACVRMTFSGQIDADTAADCRRLFERVMFNLPADDPPLLVRMIQHASPAGAKVWLVRRIAALATADNDVLRQVYAVSIEMEKRLDLTGNAILSVAQIPMSDNEPPNIIWLVQYLDASSAQAAHDRYQPRIQAAETDLDANTIIAAPEGPYLAGSWAAGQESLKPLLPLLSDALSK